MPKLIVKDFEISEIRKVKKPFKCQRIIKSEDNSFSLWITFIIISESMSFTSELCVFLCLHSLQKVKQNLKFLGRGCDWSLIWAPYHEKLPGIHVISQSNSWNGFRILDHWDAWEKKIDVLFQFVIWNLAYTHDLIFVRSKLVCNLCT